MQSSLNTNFSALVAIPPQCKMDADCASKLACFGGECKNPCFETKPCGKNAQCMVVDSLPLRTMSCLCLPGFVGDADIECKLGKIFTLIDCCYNSFMPLLITIMFQENNFKIYLFLHFTATRRLHFIIGKLKVKVVFAVFLLWFPLLFFVDIYLTLNCTYNCYIFVHIISKCFLSNKKWNCIYHLLHQDISTKKHFFLNSTTRTARM